jgi:hypothetical protein
LAAPRRPWQRLPFLDGLVFRLVESAHVRFHIDTQFHVGSCDIRRRQISVELADHLVSPAAVKAFRGAKSAKRQVKMIAQGHGQFLCREMLPFNYDSNRTRCRCAH